MSPTSPQRFDLRSIAVHAYGPSALGSIGVGAVQPVLALRARELGAGVQLAALVLALFAIGPLLASLPAGALVDRIGERRALVAAGIVDATAMTGAIVAPTIGLYAVALLVSGTAWTVFLLARQGYMIDAVPPDWRARALALLGGTQRVGLLVGPLAGAVLIGRWGVGAPFVLGAMSMLAASAIAWTMPDLDAPRRAGAEETPSVVRVVARHRGVLLTLGVVVMVISGLRAVRVTLLPLWADHIGLTAQQTSLVFGLAAGVELALVYPAGWAMDRLGRTWVAVSCIAVMALGFAVLPLATALITFAAAALVIGVGNGLGSGIVMTLGADTAPTSGRAQFLGAWRLAGEAGNSAGPLLVAAIAAASLAASCLAVAAVALVGVALSVRWVGRLDRRRAG